MVKEKEEKNRQRWELISTNRIQKKYKSVLRTASSLRSSDVVTIVPRNTVTILTPMKNNPQQDAAPNPDSRVLSSAFAPSALFVVPTFKFLPLD